MPRSMVLLTWGHSNPRTAKTATGLLRFSPEECVAVFDPDNAGRRAEELLGVGGTPIISALEEAPDADTLVMGIAPPGGKIPEKWRAVILEAMHRGWNVLSGLHDFLGDDPEFAATAQARSVLLTDVRKNSFREIARYPELSPTCLRLHTVGHDCGVGKMLVSLAIARGLQQRGRRAKFLATGQTGIMVSGEGLPIDCVVADFVSGAAEKLILDSQDQEIVVVEGQGSLVHPSYSAVTLGLLHGCRPHGLIFVFEAGREHVGGLDHVPLPSLSAQRSLFETMANVHQPCQTIALAMNGSKLSAAAAKQTAQEVEDELELPVSDIVRDGPERLLETVEQFYQHGPWRG